MALEITITYGPNETGEWILDVDTKGLPPLLAQKMVEEAQDVMTAVEVDDDEDVEAG